MLPHLISWTIWHPITGMNVNEYIFFQINKFNRLTQSHNKEVPIDLQTGPHRIFCS